jgi:hypothetical protein
VRIEVARRAAISAFESPRTASSATAASAEVSSPPARKSASFSGRLKTISVSPPTVSGVARKSRGSGGRLLRSRSIAPMLSSTRRASQ